MEKLTLMLRYSVIFLFILLSSCGARKVAINKTDSVLKVDSTSTIKKEELVVTQNNVSINTDTDEVEITPIDSTKPLFIEGKRYFNAKFRYKKTKTMLVDTTKKTEVKKEAQQVKVIKNKKEREIKKDIDKKESYSIYLWWLLIILLVALGLYVKNKLPKILS